MDLRKRIFLDKGFSSFLGKVRINQGPIWNKYKIKKIGPSSKKAQTRINQGPILLKIYKKIGPILEKFQFGIGPNYTVLLFVVVFTIFLNL